jgi:hypothetical protein
MTKHLPSLARLHHTRIFNADQFLIKQANIDDVAAQSQCRYVVLAPSHIMINLNANELIHSLTSPSAPSKSLPKRKSRIARSHSGFG